MKSHRGLPALAAMALVGVAWGALSTALLLAGSLVVPVGVAVLIEAVLVLPGFVGFIMASTLERARSGTRPRLVTDSFPHVPRGWWRVSAGLWLVFGISALTGAFRIGVDPQDRMALSVFAAFGVAAATGCLAMVTRKPAAAVGLPT